MKREYRAFAQELFKKYHLTNWKFKYLSLGQFYFSHNRLEDMKQLDGIIIGRATGTKTIAVASELFREKNDYLIKQNILHEVAHAILIEKFGGFSSIFGHGPVWRVLAYSIGYRFPNWDKLFYNKYNFKMDVTIDMSEKTAPDSDERKILK